MQMLQKHTYDFTTVRQKPYVQPGIDNKKLSTKWNMLFFVTSKIFIANYNFKTFWS